jgi:hypothetical protein
LKNCAGRNEASGTARLRSQLGEGIWGNEATLGRGHHALDGGQMRDQDLIGIEQFHPPFIDLPAESE